MVNISFKSYMIITNWTDPNIWVFLHVSHNCSKALGSFYISGKLPTSPEPAFCPKWEVSVNVGFGEGSVGMIQALQHYM